MRNLKEWFRDNARDLPWRGEPSPYEVWVSEVMLQQTQVAVVIPYFLRWMEHFPTIAQLAAAPEEDVLKLWEGLGYYSRARHLHAGAKQVMNEYSGQLPNDPKSLQSIRGLGPYTVGAILSFAFKQKAVAVDGNVLRVLARYYAVQEDISKSTTVAYLKDKALELLPDEEPWEVAEALIELGATVCTRQPQCLKCPIKYGCQAFQKGISAELPIKKERPATIKLHRLTAILEAEKHVLLRKVKKGKIMAGLFEFPYLEVDSAPKSADALIQWIQTTLGLEVQAINPCLQTKHSFTRYQATLYPYQIHCKKLQTCDGYDWYSFEELQKLTFPSGHRSLLCHINFNAETQGQGRKDRGQGLLGQ